MLVSIPDFLGNQMPFLNAVLDEYRSYKKYDVTINVHSTVQIPRTDINLIFHDPKKVARLAYVHRQEFFEARNDYDLYLFSENDILIKEETVDTYLKYADVLPGDHCLGFIRFEKRVIDDPNDPTLYCIDLWPHVGYMAADNVVINGNPYFVLRNPHQSCYLLTRAQLNFAIGNSSYLRTDWVGLESAASGVYKNWEHADGALRKVWTRNKEDLKKCLVGHISNVHCNAPYRVCPDFHKLVLPFDSLLTALKLT